MMRPSTMLTPSEEGPELTRAEAGVRGEVVAVLARCPWRTQRQEANRHSSGVATGEGQAVATQANTTNNNRAVVGIVEGLIMLETARRFLLQDLATDHKVNGDSSEENIEDIPITEDLVKDAG